MNRVAGNKAISAQDTQRQQLGEPTAAQQAQAAFTEPAKERREFFVPYRSPTKVFST
jgi:hypothetical protein